MNRLLKRRRRGFTLIEIAVAVGVMVILAGVAVPYYLGKQADAKDARIKNHMMLAYQSAAADRAHQARNIWSNHGALAVYASRQTTLDVGVGPCPFFGESDRHLMLDEISDERRLIIWGRSESGKIFRLVALGHHRPQLIETDQCLAPLDPATPEEEPPPGDPSGETVNSEEPEPEPPPADPSGLGGVAENDPEPAADTGVIPSELAATSSYADVVLGHGPVLYWPMWIDPGQVVQDISGLEHDGRAHGSVHNHTGGVTTDSGSIRFSGGYLAGPGGNELNLGEAWSLSLWVRTPDLTRARAVGVVRSAGAMWLDENRPMVTTRDGGALFGAGTLRANTWHHMVAVQSATDLRLYLDGELVGSTVTGVGSTINSVPTRFGADPESPDRPSRFEGQIDEVAVFMRAITPTEVAEQYAAAGR